MRTQTLNPHISNQVRTKESILNGCTCTNTKNGCGNIKNGILETLLGSEGEPLTEVGISLSPQSLLMLGAVVLGAGLMIKKL
jgi:hypothetical protein